MVRVKICGITRPEDAEAAVEAGADFLGFNFYPRSPRYVNPSQVRAIISDLPRAVPCVGVFVNEPPARVKEVCESAGLGMAQLHGEETPEQCREVGLPVIKAFRPAAEKDLQQIKLFNTWAVLVDAKTDKYGGSGKPADWSLARKAGELCLRLFLAGGLNPGNVAEAVRAVSPWAVDVASGVEKEPGIKDNEKMKRFIEAAKNAG